MSDIEKPAVEHLIVVQGSPQPAAGQPSQSELQDAFVMTTGKKPRIVIDMALALPIAQDLVRQARSAAFAKNDAAYVRASQTGALDTIEQTAAKGSALRDAPSDPRLAAAKTPDELLAAVDAIVAEF